MIDLPAHTPWPARLLGLESVALRPKTRIEVDREYGRDKWGALLAWLTSYSGVTTADADAYYLGDGPVACSEGDLLFTTSIRDAHLRHIDAITRRLARFARPVTIELGAGYGSVLFALARAAAADARFIAAELTTTGQKCLAALAVGEGRELDVIPCDLASTPIVVQSLPPGSLIYTSMAAMYVPTLKQSFVDNLISLAPAVVAHFEPMPSHYGSSLLGLLRRRYTAINDYNKNLLDLLRTRAAAGDIEIIQEDPCVFGENCLLPCSFVAWSPRTCST